MIKNNIIPIAIAVAAVTGAAVGVLWLFAGQSINSVYWQYWQWEPRFVTWIAYSSCPFMNLEVHRLSIVVVPFLNGIIYGLLVYLMLRKRPVISVGIIFGYAMAAFWVIAIDAGMNGAAWPPNWESWLAYATCPFVGFIGTGKLNEGFLPLLNAMYVLLLIYVIRRFAKRPAALISIILGYAVGMFFAVVVNDGHYGINFRDWFPNWISWFVYVTCPFVVIVRPYGFANGLVPLLNAFYWLLIFSLFTRIYHRFRII